MLACSASIRIPIVPTARAVRIELRFPDPAITPYLGFSVMLMAGLDRIKNKIHPDESLDKDLYDLPKEEADAIPQVAVSFEEALTALDANREFLAQGDVFSNEAIDAFIELKKTECEAVSQATHPIEFDLYYNV